MSILILFQQFAHKVLSKICWLNFNFKIKDILFGKTSVAFIFCFEFGYFIQCTLLNVGTLLNVLYTNFH